MFKVICIDARPYGDYPEAAKLLVEGSEYTVVMVGQCIHGGEVYLLKEVKHPISDCAWNPQRFIPLSAVDERTIQKNRELDKIIDVFSHEHSI